MNPESMYYSQTQGTSQYIELLKKEINKLKYEIHNLELENYGFMLKVNDLTNGFERKIV